MSVLVSIYFSSSLYRWIIKVKEERKLTQRVLEEILLDITDLCTDIVSNLRKSVSTELESLNMKMEDMP